MKIIEHIKSGIAWNIFGFFSRFIIGLGSSIIFVRLLGQHDYGIVTFVLSWVFFAGIITNLGMGTVITKSIAQERAQKQKSHLISMLKKVTMARLIVIAVLGIIFFFSPELSEWIGKPYVGKFLYFVPLLVFTAYYQGMFKTLLTAYYEQKFTNLTSTLEMLLKLGLVVLAVYYNYNIIGFFAAIMLSEIFNGTQLIWRAWHRIFRKLPEVSVPFDLKSNIPLAYRSFLVAISIRLLGRESDLFLLGIFHHDIRQVAIYAVIFGLPNMLFEVFRNMIGGGLGLTAFTELAKSGKIDELKRTYYQLLQFFSILLFPCIVGGILVGGDLAVMMYGNEYQGLNLALAILFISLGIGSISSITADILYSLDQDRNLMLCQIIFGVLNIIVNILVIPKYGALGVAITTGAACVGITFVEMFLIHRLIKPGYPIKNWLLYLAISCIMGVCVYLAPFAFYWKITIGVLVYGILFWIQDTIFNQGENLRLILKLKK